MERQLVHLPLGMFLLTAMAAGLFCMGYPLAGWVVVPGLVVSLIACVVSACFTTRYTTYQRTADWHLKLFFCMLVATLIPIALGPWLPLSVGNAVSMTYFGLLAAVYLLLCRREQRANWSDFGRTLKSPFLVIEKTRVRRIVPLHAKVKSKSSSSSAANLGGALGIFALSLVGVVFGASGKELLVLVVMAGFMVSPFLLMKYMVRNSVGIREVRKVERQRGQCFEFHNLEAIQEARRQYFVARLLNPRLRRQV